MSRSLDVSVLVRLVDRITGPLRGIQRAFDRFGQLAQRIGVLGAAIAAISFMGLIQQAAEFDQKLRDMVVTAGEFGSAAEARIRGVKAELFELALQVGLTANSLTEAKSTLTAAGMESGLIDRLLPTIGRVSKAANAIPKDVSKVAFALNNTFKVSEAQMETALGQLVAAGKLGRFEFRDMAKFLPELSAQLKGLGVTGMEAVATMGAALQVAMFGTDSTDTAANNFKNFLANLLSPDALKNFREMGVDMTKVMNNALAKGINPLEAALQKISTLTGVSQKEIDAIFKGAKGKGKTDAEAMADVKARITAILGRSKLGEMFADMQVQDFLIPFLMNKDKYDDYKKAIQAAGLDEIARDFATQMAGLGTQLTIFNQILDIFKDRVGIAFGSNLSWMNDGLITVLGYVKQVDAAFPGLIDQVLTFGGAGLVLVAALGLLGPVISIFAAGIGVIAGVIGAVLSPIGLLVAALVGAAAIIYSNWSEFAPFFSGIWDGVKEVFTAGVAFVEAIFAGDWAGAEAAGARFLAGLGKIGSGLGSVLGKLGSIVLNWALNQLPAPMRAAAERAIAALTDGFGRAGNIVRGVGIMLGSAASTIGERLSGAAGTARQAWDQMLSWLGPQAGAALDRVGNAADQAWASIKAGASSFGSEVARVFTDLSNMSDDDWRQAGVRLGNAIMDGGTSLVSWAQELPGKMGSAISGGASDLLNAGSNLIQQLEDGAKAKFDSLISWVSQIPARIKGAIGSIDLSSMIKVPSWLGGGGGTDAPKDGANDNAPAAPPAATPGAQKTGFAPMPGRSMADAGFAPAGGVSRTAAAPAAAPQEPITGRIVVEAAPGTTVREASTENRNVALVAGRGPVIGRA